MVEKRRTADELARAVGELSDGQRTRFWRKCRALPPEFVEDWKRLEKLRRERNQTRDKLSRLESLILKMVEAKAAQLGPLREAAEHVLAVADELLEYRKKREVKPRFADRDAEIVRLRDGEPPKSFGDIYLAIRGRWPKSQNDRPLTPQAVGMAYRRAKKAAVQQDFVDSALRLLTELIHSFRND